MKHTSRLKRYAGLPESRLMGTPRMPRFDVTIAGELNLDLILYGLPDELPPERELLADRMMLTLVGSSSIVAHYLQRALRPRVVELLQRMKASGLTVSLDTNDDPDDRWEGGLAEVLRSVDIFLPNEREAKLAAGTKDLEAAILRLADIVPLVVVKLGPEGALAQRGATRFRSPAWRVEAVDAVGAGDSFDARFLHHFLLGPDRPPLLGRGYLAGAPPPPAF